MRAQPHAAGEAFEIEFFIWGMRIIIGQREAKQERFGTELPFEIVHDRNRAAFAHQNWFAAKCLLQRTQSSLRFVTLGRNQIRITAMSRDNFKTDCFWTNAFEMSRGELANLLRFLIWHKPERELCSRLGWNNRFAALALITAGQSID